MTSVVLAGAEDEKIEENYFNQEFLKGVRYEV